MDGRLSRLVQQGYRHFFAMDRMKIMDQFREICHGHQRALSPWSKKERERVTVFTLDEQIAVK